MYNSGKNVWGLIVLLFVLSGSGVWVGCEVMDGLAGSVVDIEDPGEPDRDNPLDKDGDNYVTPEIDLKALQPGTNSEYPQSVAIDTHSVDFNWVGKPDSLADIMEFRYRLDEQDWSDWSSGGGSISYTYMDDREYNFEVEVKYESDTEAQNNASRSVTIDAVNGPAITYWPRSEDTYTASDIIDVEVYLDEVEDVAGVKSILTFNPNMLEVASVNAYQSSGLLAQNGGSILYLSGPNETAGEQVLNFVTLDGSPSSVSGSGAIAQVQFRVRTGASGQTSIGFSSSSITRTPENTNQQLMRFVEKPIVIE